MAPRAASAKPATKNSKKQERANTERPIKSSVLRPPLTYKKEPVQKYMPLLCVLRHTLGPLLGLRKKKEAVQEYMSGGVC
jgi:hypothetical protein